ncbi:CYFA0S11e00474g1_1 [Cyberlindnera fabianii]|uniref:CYFA0S11e00474g1_1 n=1 Tax=Cyberlindnera fabianii TaxID=36022 RepID=A0A061B891_CYBFA|nr:CYFA0S11e00474g1_1 [Cyberlindnera fabianii]
MARQPIRGAIALNPVTVVVKECILISSSMRKLSKYSQSGVAAILGGGASDIFNDNNDLKKYGLSGNSNNHGSSQSNDPLLSGFIQLRQMLNNRTNLSDIDSLTLLQPFLLVIKSSSTSGNITSLALDSLTKFISYKIISKDSKNLSFTLNHIMHSLTHCRFEASEQTSDDSVLLKVLKLLESMIDSDLGDMLSDDVIYEVVQTSLSLACNKRRSEVLRRAAELSVYRITIKIFKRLDDIEPENNELVIEETHDYARDQLVETIGASGEDNVPKKSFEVPNDDKPFGLPAIKQFLGILISMIAPENQFRHTESTKVFALSLIATAAEMSADRFSKFPTLLNLIADPIFKHALQIIQTVNSIPVLQAAMQLFTTLMLTLGDQLPAQVELALTTIMTCILPPPEKKNTSSKSGKSTPVDTNIKSPSAKELMIDELSILWTRSPTLFVDLFSNYDCNFHRQDLTVQFIEFLAKLSLPENSRVISESVPATCLEGVLTFINHLYEHVEKSPAVTNTEVCELISTKEQKREFIAATNVFNNKPKDGLKELQKRGFIKSLDDTKELARFFFEKSSRLNKKILGEYLAKPTNKDLLTEFMNLFEFKGLRVDEALRVLLKTFRLPGESQQIERIVETFSAWYVECQGYQGKQEGAKEEATPKAVDDVVTKKVSAESTDAVLVEEEDAVEPDADSVFVLSYSIIMLNTDLYNMNVKDHMTFESYKRNVSGTYNGKNYPDWYLQKIFNSIAEKEIVMPEEHHGSSQWFGDTWNNMMAANASLVTDYHNPYKFNEKTVLQLESYIFQASFTPIVDTVLEIFSWSSDDGLTTRILSTVDHIARITSFFSLHDQTDMITKKLCDFTRLTDIQQSSTVDPSVTTPLKLTRIKVEGGETIDVSDYSVRFGQTFKGQLSVVVLFRIVKQNMLYLTESWPPVIKIIFTLLENGMIEPDIFADFQKQNHLHRIPRIKPEVTLTRSQATKGLFSTFASYLKGDDEPSDDDVNLTLSALDCIKSANIASLLDDVKALGQSGAKLVPLFLEYYPTERNQTTEKYFETQLFFVVETCVNLIIINDPTSHSRLELIEKINDTIKSKDSLKIKPDFIFRLSTYKLILFRHGAAVNEELLVTSLEELASFDREILEKKTPQILTHLTTLVNDGCWSADTVLNAEVYWRLLRQIASITDYTNSVLLFAEKVPTSRSINNTNFMWLLGLLDEISAVGSIGAQWEQEYDMLIKTGHKVTKENPYQDIVHTSLRSIKFTGNLLELDRTFTKEETYALIQALAHQCLNPCQQIRSYALGALENTILQIKTGEDVTAQGIFEFGLLPLLNEGIAKLEIFQLISKVYLHFYELDQANNEIFLKILDTFNQYLDDTDIEAELQKLIGTKKALEKQSKESDSTTPDGTTPEPELTEKVDQVNKDVASENGNGVSDEIDVGVD